eukprot:GEMP01037396.1.p1 GENE.GEMP01037396.1~~GEMP01037396.1.p1  ORF type:complete len:165 (+),score=27.18 GEMP01037396.1:165-659(+)
MSFYDLYPSLLDRTFVRRYRPDGVYCHQHLNGLLLVGLADDHEALKNGPVARIEFADELRNNNAHGKRNKGGTSIYPDTKICDVVLSSGKTFPVTAGIRGNLVECNSRLDESPDLLRTGNEGERHFAIVQIHSKKHDAITTCELEKMRMVERRAPRGAGDNEDD